MIKPSLDQESLQLAGTRRKSDLVSSHVAGAAASSKWSIATRECLLVIADTSISGRRVVRELTALVARRGKPG